MRNAVLQALGATLIWGVSFIAIRIALETVAPLDVVWVRNSLGAAVLYGLLKARGEKLLPAPVDRGRSLLLGLIMGAHMLIQTLSMRMTSAMRAGWIVAFIPVVVAVGARLFLGQRMRAIGWVGIAIATCGVFVLTSARPSELAQAGAGDALMLASTFTWAAYSLLSTETVRRNGGLRISAASLAISALPTFALAATESPWHATPSLRSIAAVAYLAVAASALAMWMFSNALAKLGPERTSAFQYIQPFVTVVASFVLLAEPFTTTQFVGGPLVLVGVWFVQRGKRGA